MTAPGPILTPDLLLTPNLLLTVDTATTQLTLGLSGRLPEGEVVQLARTPQVGRAHAERLPAELEALLSEAGLGVREAARRVSGILVGTGPGSYTGLRVGASYALGLGRAWGVPVRGVSTLEGLTGGAEDGPLAVSLDARKGQVYAAVYQLQGGVVTGTPRAPRKWARDDFAAEVAALAVPWREDTPEHPLFPDPQALARGGRVHGAAGWTLSYL